MFGTRLRAGCAALLIASAWAMAEGQGPVAILEGGGVWRALYSWAAPLVQTPDGLKERRRESGQAEAAERPDFDFMTVYPPAGWAGADFDDSGWPRRHFFARYANGETDPRAGGGGASPYVRQLCLRAKFTVTDPSRVGALWLTMAYRGGAAVYVNGAEAARAHLPAGPIEPGSPAEIYPPKAYLKDSGKPWHWWNDRDTIPKEAYPLRVRSLDKLPIPARLLRKGTNVLAVELHAAPYPEAQMKAEPFWGTCGLIDLRLEADGGEGIVPDVVRPRGLQVWNTSVAEQVHDACWADPHDRLGPIRMAAPRNGVCSGRVAVGSDQPLKGLQAKAADLAGPGGAALPVTVWFGRLDAPRASRWGGGDDASFVEWGQLPRLRDDALVEAPLASGALRTIWLVAEVPRDARPGDYRGTLTITLDGHEPVAVPVELRVIGWTEPDPADYAYWMGMIESPEAVALTYGVPPWSERHCALVAKSLEWVGKLGPKVLYLPLGAESQYGNEQSMVLWVRGADGGMTHDFSRVEKYLDLALEHLGKPRFVVAGVWDSCSHVSAPKELRRDFPKLSVLEPKTGRITTADGPRHGTPESLAFWKPILTRLRDLAARRGLTLLLGFCADRQPDKATVGVFRAILPDVEWQATRHPPIRNDELPCDGGAVLIRYQANVWGGWDNWDPATRRVYGWKHPAERGLRVWLDRGLFDACPVVQFRTACEQSLLADRHGLGQIGADFWPVTGPDGKPTVSMVGRFPATSEGNLGIYSGQLLYPGPDGPVPTVRYQMMRENIQECEARIFLERLLLEAPCRLPAALAERCQTLLDERTRWHRAQNLRLSPEAAISWPYSGWEARREKLFEGAAEAAKAIAGKESQ